jgi:uncharacterized protein (DUF2236 family)
MESQGGATEHVCEIRAEFHDARATMASNMVIRGPGTISPADLERLLNEVKNSAAGNSEGIFGPGSVSWKINRESALFLAAGRAALLQLAHPWVAAAIAEHSTTLHNPVGRFHRTCRVMFTIVFGTLDQALEAARQLHRRHSGIRGKMPETFGPFAQGSEYYANDVAALRWVFATLVDSALLAYELVLPPLTAAERRQYYVQSRITAALFGIPREELPSSLQEFRAYFESMLQSSTLVVSGAGREIAQELQSGAGTWLRPPFWYRTLTTHLLPSRLREEFQLPYNKREQRSAERALRWLPTLYSSLPASLRFVGPYLEALTQRNGKTPPGFGTRLSNRLWIGESSLFPSGKAQQSV